MNRTYNIRNVNSSILNVKFTAFGSLLHNKDRQLTLVLLSRQSTSYYIQISWDHEIYVL